MTKSNSGKKGSIWLICPGLNPSLREDKVKAQDRNLKAGLLAIPHNITSDEGTQPSQRNTA